MPPRTRSKKKISIMAILIIVVAGFMIPQKFSMPVEGASHTSYHPDSFWYYPWGRSVTHKGVDIFTKEGTPINSATNGVVLYTGHIGMGGNIVLILGSKWRLHYYAHMRDTNTHPLSLVTTGEKIGSVGDSGNAKGKPPHLHYSIVTLIPYVWQIDTGRQGWKKMFYLNPITYIENR
jgi:murein DD-endopeptidase MepM/ murein hydrolase activator NlpD